MRQKIVLTPQQLAQVLGLPEDVQVVEVQAHWPERPELPGDVVRLHVVFEGPELPADWRLPVGAGR